MDAGSPMYSAGRSGADVRSDCFVTLRRGAAQRSATVRSKVEGMYGERIRADVAEVLDHFGAHDVELQLDDQGALPWVMSARIECALRRAGYEASGPAPLPSALPPREPSARDRRRRSRLYLPGNEPKFMLNAGFYGADALILDLEDSVHVDAKDAARLLVRNALRCVEFGGAEAMVRINAGEQGREDLTAIVPQGVDVVLVPKVETAAEVRAVDAHITELQERAGLERPLWLMPILESALGIENAFAIATASARVVALTIGLEDYTADLGVVKTRTGEESLFARQRLLNAAKAAQIQAIDSVYGDVGDQEGLAAWCERARAMGYTGMGCVHPRQIDVIHRGFAPTPEEVEKARRIVAAYEEAQAQGRSVVSLGTKMIDPPVVKRALKLVESAREGDRA